MATGTLSDFKIYEEQFFGGVFEVLERQVEAFNAATVGAMRLTTDFMKGQFKQESFFQKPADLIQHRDPTDVTAATATKLTQSELKSPKINKRIGPVENTLDSFKKIGVPIEQMSFILGQQTAPDIMGAYLESAVNALVGSFSVTALNNGLVHDATAGTMTNTALIKGMAKLGDMANRIRIWVMHSKVYFDLMQHNVTEKLLEVTAGTLYNGTIPTFGKPVFVTDTPSLYDANTSVSTDDVYWTFGLTDGAVDVVEAEERSMLIEVVGGLKNLVARYQGEFAYEVRVKGMAWATQVNPTDAQLATNTNWAKAYADLKSLAGIAIKSK